MTNSLIFSDQDITTNESWLNCHELGTSPKIIYNHRIQISFPQTVSELHENL